MTIDDRKRAQRQDVLAALGALSPAERGERSRAIATRLVAHPAFAAAGVVALYASLGTEVDTGPVAMAAAGAGKLLAWPRMSAAERRLAFAACAPAALVPGPMGTLEPPPAAPRVTLDVIDLALVPGVAFDGALRRLGRGGGHYDATLAALPARALRFGLAFDCQVVDEVPAEAHDLRVDLVVTETRLIGPVG
ncbi:MAG TPA: 5-formyltetrahydrofolate cyclo-ligase [Anaeromyxobacteraceae bacterium]